MKVVVDGFNLALEKGTGVATYARNLTQSLHENGHEVHVLYGQSGAAGKNDLLREIAFFDESSGTRNRLFGKMRRITGALANPFARPISAINFTGTVIHRQFASRMPVFDQIWNSADLFQQAATYFRLHGRRLRVASPKGAAITHWTYPLPVKACGTKNIYTLHDLVPLRLPYTTLDKKRHYFKLVKQLTECADHIVTVSETSKKDIVNILGVPEDKITNTYQAVSIPEAYLSLPTRTLRSELGAFRLQYKKYLLFFGSIEPKKNIGRIIEAYLASGIDLPLVVVGAQAWKNDQELKMLKNEALASQYEGERPGPKVKHLEYVSFPQLVNLIRAALAVTFPSLYEGFGLPILESMICGTPVITSNLGSMLEIGGDAAIYVDPYSTREIKDAMVAVVRNADLRAEKIARGAAVAQRFSPEAYQKRLEGLYSRLTAPMAADARLAPVRA